MLSNLSKLFTVQLPPLLTLVSAFLILFTFLSPVPMHNDSLALVTIAPGSTSPQLQIRDAIVRRLPRAAAAAVVERSATQTSAGPFLTFGFLGSCTKETSTATAKCTASSLNPTYDLTALPSALRTTFIAGPPQTSPQWTIITILAIFTFVTLTILPLFIAKLANHAAFCRIAAWIGIIGWVTGIVTVIVLHVTFANAASTFNMMAANQKSSQLVASLGNGFTGRSYKFIPRAFLLDLKVIVALIVLWVAFSLAVPSLVCTLFSHKLHEEAKSG
ncbi:hypothetical protein FRB96_008459 [Tulasnella sp. 330]|nr:hypothetical protein FRB96_008459 [Tulasnella sp. 330]KAG8883982.1 hypothetical protein FRB97_005426 [Tulasnella sp. 331]KAG8889307.1 hypothetical protein FRB98_004924 [Tulasnella sp. 332]